MNTYFTSSAFNTNNLTTSHHGPQIPGGFVGSRFTQPGFNNALPSSYMTALPGPTPQIPTNNSTMTSGITPDNMGGLMDKPISELTVADIIKINMISNDPMQKQLNEIQKDFKTKFQNLDNRMNILEQEKQKIQEENNVLKNVVINMQKCLNKLDSDERNNNAMISGVPEADVQLPNGSILKTDKDKINWIMQRTENERFHNNVGDLNVSRLGETKPGYNRVIKVILPNNEDRNEFLKNAVKMKDAPTPWDKIYLKKDQHPVYRGENNRLRKKAAELKKKQGNENKDIKIVKGHVMVDNTSVDHNLFFP